MAQWSVDEHGENSELSIPVPDKEPLFCEVRTYPSKYTGEREFTIRYKANILKGNRYFLEPGQLFDTRREAEEWCESALKELANSILDAL